MDILEEESMDILEGESMNIKEGESMHILEEKVLRYYRVHANAIGAKCMTCERE